MDKRRKTGDGTRLPEISRRAVIGGAGFPLAGTPLSWSATSPSDISSRCAAAAALEKEIERLSARWSELEATAVAQFDYFNLSVAQVMALPMGPEMAAIEIECGRLHEEKEAVLAPLGRMTPRNVQEATALLAIAYQMLRLSEEEPWPFIQKASTFLSKSHCPGCGAAYGKSEMFQ